MIEHFRGEYDFLSNFCLAPTMYDGRLYSTSEHAYAAAKTLNPDMRIRISKIQTPREAKAVGRRLSLRSDWELVKVPIMHQIVRDKFVRNLELRERLIATGEQELVEGNYWGDEFWGVNMKTRIGENRLGKILMLVRGEFK